MEATIRRVDVRLERVVGRGRSLRMEAVVFEWTVGTDEETVLDRQVVRGDAEATAAFRRFRDLYGAAL